MTHFLYAFSSSVFDERLISPHGITPESITKVMRIKKKNDNHLKKLWIVKQILLVSFLGNLSVKGKGFKPA